MPGLLALPADPAAWDAHAAALDASARWALGEAISREWIEGRLEPQLIGNASPGVVIALRRQLARVLETCAVADDLEIEWGNGNIDEASARRWCWIGPWRLMSQDEDLFLMADSLVVPLLEEATLACPKRDYAISIVQHHIRDQIHAALRGGADAVRARIRESMRFREAAIAGGITSLEDYLNRLETHERPGKITQEEARARIADVWRCHAPKNVELEPLSNEEWRAKYSAIVGHEEWIVVQRKTGAMRIDAAKKKR